MPRDRCPVPPYKQRRLARAAALRNRVLININGDCDPAKVRLIRGALAQFEAHELSRRQPPAAA